MYDWKQISAKGKWWKGRIPLFLEVGFPLEVPNSQHHTNNHFFWTLKLWRLEMFQFMKCWQRNNLELIHWECYSQIIQHKLVLLSCLRNQIQTSEFRKWKCKRESVKVLLSCLRYQIQKSKFRKWKCKSSAQLSKMLNSEIRIQKVKVWTFCSVVSDIKFRIQKVKVWKFCSVVSKIKFRIMNIFWQFSHNTGITDRHKH